MVLGVGLKFNLTTEYGGPFNRRVSFYIDTSWYYKLRFVGVWLELQ